MIFELAVLFVLYCLMCPSSCRFPPTWQLWVDLLSQVLGQVPGHLPTDVHQDPGLCGRDLVDEHRAGVGQDQFCMVCPVLGRVLRTAHPEERTEQRLELTSGKVEPLGF